MDTRATLANLLRSRKAQILEKWAAAVRERPIAKPLSPPLLLDSMPFMLDDLAEAVEKNAPQLACRRAPDHAHQRLGLGYEVGQLVGEYIDLRRSIYAVLEDAVEQITVPAWRTMNELIDESVNDVMERFSRARQQKLRAFERISSEPLAAKSLDELLGRLLDVMAEVAPVVDTVTILLREGNMLRVRASRGLESELARDFSIAIGDGFAGIIASTREPLLLHEAANDPRVKSSVIRERGVKVLYGVPLLDARGELVGVAHVGSTSATELQEEDLILFRGLANRATALIESRREVDQLLDDEQQREQFIGVLGHDLRSPLNAILGSARFLLSAGSLDERNRAMVARIVRSGDRMNRLVNDLFDFARARLGEGISLHKAWVDLNELVRDVADEQRAAHPGKRVDVTASLPFRVCCDHDRIAQVLSNLVGNAIVHGAPEHPITVRLEERGEDVRILVHNEGPPIPPEIMPHIFDPFRRGADAGVPGIGLGLFIARAIVGAHRGSLDVSSTAEGGTTFAVQLAKSGKRA